MAVQVAATSIGHPETPEQEIEAYLAAGSMSLIREVLGTNERFDEAFGHFTKHYADHMLDNTKPYEGVISLLDDLKRRKKKLAVMSNKREAFCRSMLQGLHMDHYFAMIVGGDTRPTKKPDPEPLLYIANTLKVDPARTMMVGDSPQDVEAAKGAGMFSVAINTGFTSAERMRTTGADIFLETINEFHRHL